MGLLVDLLCSVLSVPSFFNLRSSFDDNFNCRSSYSPNLEREKNCYEVSFEISNSGLIIEPILDYAFDIWGIQGELSFRRSFYSYQDGRYDGDYTYPPS